MAVRGLGTMEPTAGEAQLVPRAAKDAVCCRAALCAAVAAGSVTLTLAVLVGKRPGLAGVHIRGGRDARASLGGVAWRPGDRVRMCEVEGCPLRPPREGTSGPGAGAFPISGVLCRSFRGQGEMGTGWDRGKMIFKS